MTIRIQCGHCGVKVETPDSDAGKTGPCPKCGKPLTIRPSPQPSASPPPEGPTQAPQLADQLPDVAEAATPDFSPMEEDEQDDGLGKFYGGEETSGSPLRWLLVLAFFVVAMGFLVYIIPRGKDGTPRSARDSSIRNLDEICREVNKLYEEARRAVAEGNVEEAIELYEGVLRELEKLPEETAKRLFNSDGIRKDYDALKAGGTIPTGQPPADEQEPEEDQPQAEPEDDQDATAPDTDDAPPE